jgi:hypothetical protein
MRIRETLERAREACAPVPPPDDALLDRAARSLDLPADPPAEQPRKPGSYELSLLQSVQRQINEAIAQEREFLQKLIALTVCEEIYPLEARIRELEADLLQVRGLLHQQDLVRKGGKPKIRVRAGSHRRPNRQWPTGKSKEHAAD